MHATGTHRITLDRDAVGGLTARSSLGAAGEELAARHLVDDHGLRVLARNWRLAAGELRGELDVVALDAARSLLVVCEVKTRRDAGRFGGALEAVGPAKRAKLRALTGAFLRDAGTSFRRVRLDLLAIDLGPTTRLTHVEDAL